jgi:hypothetical protein
LRIRFRERAALRPRGLQLRLSGARLSANLVHTRLRQEAAIKQHLEAGLVRSRTLDRSLDGGDAGRARLGFERQTLIADNRNELAAPHIIALSHEEPRERAADAGARIANIAARQHSGDDLVIGNDALLDSDLALWRYCGDSRRRLGTTAPGKRRCRDQ